MTTKKSNRPTHRGSLVTTINGKETFVSCGAMWPAKDNGFSALIAGYGKVVFFPIKDEETPDPVTEAETADAAAE